MKGVTQLCLFLKIFITFACNLCEIVNVLKDIPETAPYLSVGRYWTVFTHLVSVLPGYNYSQSIDYFKRSSLYISNYHISPEQSSSPNGLRKNWATDYINKRN